MADFKSVINELEIKLQKSRGDALDNTEGLHKQVGGLNSELTLLKEMLRSAKV